LSVAAAALQREPAECRRLAWTRQPITIVPPEAASAFAAFETGRVLASLAVLAASGGAVRLCTRIAQRGAGGLRQRRGHLAWVRNLGIGLGAVALLFIWGSLIAGFALSLAAVAGAALIVSKEFLMNLLGFAMLALTRPYRIDDFVELAGVRGRVIGIGLVSTAIAETLEGNQLTGRTVSVPNSVLLTHPARNETATGHFIVQLVSVGAQPNSDLDALEKCLREAAHEVCQPWLDEAGRHLALIESRSFVDLPSPAPRVLLNLSDGRHPMLALRYVCRVEERVKVEQDILRRYWRKARALPGALGSMAVPALH
jgi:small-conductance mechanosensitive channel